MIKIEIHTEYIKLDQFLKFTGVADSGANAKELISSGLVKVNDVVAEQRGKKLRNKDKVEVYDKVYQIESKE